MGDFHAHNASWYSSTRDDRAATQGAEIVSTLDNTSLMVINQDTAKIIPLNGTTSSPDLTLANSYLGINVNWQLTTTQNSDHLPIIFDLDGWFAEPINPGPSYYTNFKKANWDQFIRETEQLFSNLPVQTFCSTGEKAFLQVLLQATKHHTARGKFPNFTPGLTQHTTELILEKDNLRETNLSDKRIPNKKKTN